jgi:uncharacterized membrane protein
LAFNRQTYKRELILTNKEFAKVTIKGLRETKDMSLQWKHESERRLDVATGIAYGLIYGIIGNLFVQFFYPVVEKLLLQTFDVVFEVDLIVSTLALIVIVITSIKLRRQLRTLSDETKFRESFDNWIDGRIKQFETQLEESS